MKTFTGTIVSTKMKNTAVVQVLWVRSHKQYKKIIHRRSRFTVDTADKQVQLGDTVLIKQVRPISKTKQFIVESVVKKI